MTKSMILPIITLLALIVKSIFHIDLGTEVQDAVAEAALALITAWGVFKNHIKKPPDQQ